MLDIWPSLAKSPVLTQFNWSPLIHAAYASNHHLWSSSSLFSLLPPSYPTGDDLTLAPIPGLLALHVRRGDFEEHCTHLGTWSSSYNGFNLFSELPDLFSPPGGGSWGENTPENMATYMGHCYPSIEQIAAKVRAVRATEMGENLKNVYVMTNGKVEWVEELKAALRADGGWEQISSSRDLKLSLEQKFVSHALDMMIGQRAQVFVGNGVRLTISPSRDLALTCVFSSFRA